MKLKPDHEVRTLKNPWSREQHYARCLPALGVVIDITPTPRVVPGVIARQPPRPEERRVNARATPIRLLDHQVELAILIDARAERLALVAANEALAPLHRSWWARAVRAVRSLVGR